MKYNIELLNQMSNVPEDTLAYQYISYLKNGGGIHIKKKNRGKFTESAKRAGKSVQEYARDVMKDPNATTLQKRRAQFALNAKKFKHQHGGTIRNLPYEIWYSLLPPQFTNDPDPKYDYEVAYKYASPQDLRNHGQGWGHLYSAYQDPTTNIYHFAKRKDHDTINLELEFYNGDSDDSKEFRNEYYLDTSGDYYKYIPRIYFKNENPYQQIKDLTK